MWHETAWLPSKDAPDASDTSHRVVVAISPRCLPAPWKREDGLQCSAEENPSFFLLSVLVSGSLLQQEATKDAEPGLRGDLSLLAEQRTQH